MKENASEQGQSQPVDTRPNVRIFSWTGKNTYCVITEPDMGFAMGGGDDGRFGLWIDKDLDRGYSAQCATFANEPLSDSAQDFFVDQLEVWTFLS